jgi:hypothetical protein
MKVTRVPVEKCGRAVVLREDAAKKMYDVLAADAIQRSLAESVLLASIPITSGSATMPDDILDPARVWIQIVVDQLGRRYCR